MKKKLISIVLTFILSNQIVFAGSFSDISEDYQYFDAIELLKIRGVINGYPDHSFRPDKKVNKVEALKMILVSANIQVSDEITKTGLFDVPEDIWFAKYVSYAKTAGIVQGNPDHSFTPNKDVNRAEFLKMLLQTFKKDLSAHQNLPNGISNDTFQGQWFLPYISYAKTVGIIYPTVQNNLNPQQNLSRGDVAEILYKMIVLEEGGDIQKMLNITESNLVSLLVYLNNNDIDKASQYANDAVFYSEHALKISSDGIVKAANQIALGFRELCFAYQSGLNNQISSLETHVLQAFEHAGNAYNFDNSTQSLGKKIKEEGEILLNQVK